MAAQFDAMAELQGTFKLLFQKKNWMLAVPVLVGSIVSFIVLIIAGFIAFGSLMAGGVGAGLSNGNNAGAMIGALFGGAGLLFLVAVVVAAVVGILSYGWAYAAAEPVWQGGDPDIGGGLSKAMAKLGPLAIAGILVALACGIVAITFIGPIVVLFFAMFVIPYIMQGGQSGTGAIGASVRLVSANFGPAAMLFLAFIVIGIVAGILNAILSFIPILGQIVVLVVASLLTGYVILAIMRFYALLTGTATGAAVSTSTT